MFKKFKISLLAACTLLGVAVISCQKNSNDVAPTPITKSQVHNSVEEGVLIRAMANDGLVRKDILTDASYVGEHMRWFRSLTPKEQKARMETVNQAIESNQSVSDPVHTAEQQQTYFTGVQARRAEIAARYPALGELTQEALSRVWSGVVGKVVTDPETSLSNCWYHYANGDRTMKDYQAYIYCQYGFYPN